MGGGNSPNRSTIYKHTVLILTPQIYKKSFTFQNFPSLFLNFFYLFNKLSNEVLI